MKRVLILLTVLTAVFAQDLKVRGMFINETAFNYFGAGIDYKLMKVSDMPLFATANFFFGSKDPVSGSVFEVGATLRKQLNDNFYLKGGALMSFTSATVDFGSPIGEITGSDSDLTLLIGAGYLINKQFSIVLDYALTGVDLLRLQVGFDL